MGRAELVSMLGLEAPFRQCLYFPRISPCSFWICWSGLLPVLIGPERMTPSSWCLIDYHLWYSFNIILGKTFPGASSQLAGF